MNKNHFIYIINYLTTLIIFKKNTSNPNNAPKAVHYLLIETLLSNKINLKYCNDNIIYLKFSCQDRNCICLRVVLSQI